MNFSWWFGLQPHHHHSKSILPINTNFLLMGVYSLLFILPAEIALFLPFCGSIVSASFDQYQMLLPLASPSPPLFLRAIFPGIVMFFHNNKEYLLHFSIFCFGHVNYWSELPTQDYMLVLFVYVTFTSLIVRFLLVIVFLEADEHAQRDPTALPEETQTATCQHVKLRLSVLPYFATCAGIPASTALSFSWLC